MWAKRWNGDGKLIWFFEGQVRIYHLHLLLANRRIVEYAERFGLSIWAARDWYDWTMEEEESEEA